MTKIINVNPENVNEDILQSSDEIKLAGDIIRNGGLVAFPTETVYGLGGNALFADSSMKIYAAKGRPSDNPLIVHISEIDEVYDVAEEVSDKAGQLMEKYWPGPLTLIFKKKAVVPKETTGGLDTVAVRLPNHSIARALIKAAGVPIAAPSANTSGRPSPTRAEHVIEDLSGKIDAIIDGGSVGIGLESTIVDMTEEVPTLLRPGFYTKKMIEDVVGVCKADPVVFAKEKPVDVKPKAPGMKYRHYAPKGQLTIVYGNKDRVISKINELIIGHKENNEKVLVIATAETKDCYLCDNVLCVGERSRKGDIASHLFGVLREADDLGAEYIYSESFENDSLGEAIMNRLSKAAGYNYIEV
ncbi:MAG: threonylcarbamoyl-AMP synthase [Lachnospiraceae bacterium]|nr:threonylcarbamoyl-AMP synthase [Lachnospiraceae bacterium]